MGRSPIFEPITNKDQMAIGFLLSHGASVNIANNSGDKAYSHGVEQMPEMEATFREAFGRRVVRN
jgi:hypothetical protein